MPSVGLSFCLCRERMRVVSQASSRGVSRFPVTVASVPPPHLAEPEICVAG
jgi:hypothetical protein